MCAIGIVARILNHAANDMVFVDLTTFQGEGNFHAIGQRGFNLLQRPAGSQRTSSRLSGSGTARAGGKTGALSPPISGSDARIHNATLSATTAVILYTLLRLG